MYTLSEINIYPLKSLAGINLQSSEVEERGLKYDRRWVLVNESNSFFTQREFPEMALIKVDVEDTGLKIHHKTKIVEPLFIPFEFEDSKKDEVIIWNDTVPGEFYNDQIDGWFSDILDTKCRLVKMPESTRRVVDKTYAKNKLVSFADGYPFLIIGQSSLDDLNSRMEIQLPMNRFRPNFVFTGGNPYEEDKWKKFKIGDVKFHAVKPCARCVITTTDQETAERAHEPLLTLSKYRKIENKVMFGMNLVCESTGEIKIGDKIEF
ncbi:MAG: MOSC domain-containing protein [Ignavibacteriaceae bacterium]|nr:MOSC domain-containing protein [Ignavibacteriaceae bacterium]MCW9098484.1 MOSC domain-containing protein [Ignavibacteriaceae bacterium]